MLCPLILLPWVGALGSRAICPSQSLPLFQPWLAQGQGEEQPCVSSPVLLAFSYQWETSTGYRYYATCARFISQKRSNPAA